jgi:hypothetical protein
MAMQIFVKTLAGRTVTLLVEPSTTVAAVKRMIKQSQRVFVKEQRLIHSGRQLDDGDRTLEQYKITMECTLHLVLRLRGQGHDGTHVTKLYPSCERYSIAIW